MSSSRPKKIAAVCLLEGFQPGIGALRQRELLGQSFLLKLAPEASQHFVVGEAGDADELGVLQKVGQSRSRCATCLVLHDAVVDDLAIGEQEHRLATVAGHHGLGDTPGRAQPVGGAEHDQGAAKA